MSERLIFVDTNVFLDFYRAQSEAGLALLRRLDSIRSKIVMTCQVEAEFKKNRQAEIIKSHRALQPPQKISAPALFYDARTLQALNKDLERAERKITLLKKRLECALLKPTTRDPVFKLMQGLFKKKDEFTLKQISKLEPVIRRKALKRFLLGYPPRKGGDTSIGDSFNWEWIIHCAANSKAEIVVVSRDTDYGATLNKESFLNDWLAQEFKSRLGRKRTIRLCTRLSEALRLFAVNVTKAETKAEDAMAKPPTTALDPTLIRKFIEEYGREDSGDYVIPVLDENHAPPEKGGLGISAGIRKFKRV